MARTTKVDEFQKALNDVLKEYAAVASHKTKTAITNTTNVVNKDVKKKAPVKTGRYKKNWRKKKTGETSTSLTYVVYNHKRYMLAHLLEHGHVLRNGGRARAFPHIAPAEESGEKYLMAELEKELSNG